MEDTKVSESKPVNGLSIASDLAEAGSGEIASKPELESETAPKPELAGETTAPKPQTEATAPLDGPAPTNGSDEKNEPNTAADSKKRKHSPSGEDDRDWRVRRDQDNARHNNGRDHPPRRGRGRGSGRDYVNYRDNIKTNYEQQPESQDPDEIRKQVEFYFSDSNLPTDKFLFAKTGGSANNPVPISVIHSFKRMRRFQPYSAVLDALRASAVLDVNEAEELTRKAPLAADLKPDAGENISLVEDKTRSRSIYAKGFGEEGASTQFDIEAFFAPYGPINAIRLRRHQDKTFKKSVFVEFDSDETANRFLALEKKPKWEDGDLLIKSKKEYILEKMAAPDGAGSRGGRGGRGDRGGRGSRGRGDRNDRARGGQDRGGRDRGGRDRGGRDNRSERDTRGGTRDRDERQARRRRERSESPSAEQDRSSTKPTEATSETPADKQVESNAKPDGAEAESKASIAKDVADNIDAHVEASTNTNVPVDATAAASAGPAKEEKDD